MSEPSAPPQSQTPVPGPEGSAQRAPRTYSHGAQAPTEVGAGAVHGSSLLVADAQGPQSKVGISNNTTPDPGSSYEPYQHETATADGRRSSAGDDSSEHDTSRGAGQPAPVSEAGTNHTDTSLSE